MPVRRRIVTPRLEESTPLPPLTLFVNTHDSYADCWEPFFALLATYWPDCPQPILLNTQRADYRSSALQVRCARNSMDVDADTELPWGERLRRGLSLVTTPYVLYLVEDLFLYDPVRTDVLAAARTVMDRADLDCVRIAEPGGTGPWRPSEHELLWTVDRSSKYLALLQAALWRTDFLRRIISVHETPWQFEAWGSGRIRRLRTPVHCLDRDRFWNDPATRVLPYDPDTGVARGLWRAEVVLDLFARHGLDVDFAQRGFLDGGELPAMFPRPPLWRRLLARLRSL